MQAVAVLILDGDPRFDETKPDGTYLFGNLPPGEYKIMAVRPGDAEVQGDEVIGCEDTTEAIALHDAEKLAKDVRLK